MKIRNGFVSNSSSSSFMVLLPDNFTLSDGDIEKAIENYPYELEVTVEDVQHSFKKLIDKGVLYEEDDNDSIIVLSEVLNEYDVGVEILAGPEEGAIYLANRERIKELL